MVIFPWPSRKLRQEAISNATQEKEQSQASAVHAADLQAQIERMAKETQGALVMPAAPGNRAQIRVLHNGHPPGRTPCIVLQSGQLADCPVRLAE